MSKKLFISHSTKDDAHVDRIADALETAGFTVWVDHRHGIEFGAPNWDKAIRDAIVEADAGIFLLSERSLASDICSAECLLVRELGDPLYVMRLEACKPENIWLFIKQIQYADLVKDFDRGINDLIRVLGGETSEELPKAVRATFTGLDTMRLYLPYLNNPLRGRDEDIKQIQGKLGAHVLQIVGPGGLGKSRLAAEIAINQPNGAIWHRCSPVSEPADLLALLREHLKLTADASLMNVLAVLSEKKPLIVVDNAEDVPDGSDKRRAYEDLLKQIVGRGVPVILTTRTIWTDLKPRPDHTPTAVSLEIAAQIALDFATAEDVALSESQAGELAEKARLHPRLIEFSVGQLHERRLDSVLRQLSELKHFDIKEALDEMITKTVMQMAAQAKHGADAEALLRRMTILQATFPLDAIKAIAPDEMKEDADRLEDALVTLQKWQFVRRDVSTERYSLRELVREALGQPSDEVFWAYAVFYTKRAGEIFTLPLEQWKEHEHDLPNILVLGDVLVEGIPKPVLPTEEPSESDRALMAGALSFARNTHRFVIYRMEYRRTAWLELGLWIAQTLGDHVSVVGFLSQLGIVQSVSGEKQKALDSFTQVLPVLHALEDRHGEAETLNNIGRIWADWGKFRKALDYFEEALSIHRLVKNQLGEANTLNNIGSVWEHLGDRRKALKYYEQALATLKSVDGQSVKAATLNNIGLVWAKLGDGRKALAYFEKALPISRSLGDQRGEATTLNNIGGTWGDLRNRQKALDYFLQALHIFDLIADIYSSFTLNGNIGTLYRQIGQLHSSIQFFERAVEIGSYIGHPRLQVTIGELAKVQKELDRLKGN